jgi:cystathionine beta-lyase
MTQGFDAPPDRCGSGSTKWSRYPTDVIPLWVADMDFAVAPPILAALRVRLDHPVLGYAAPRAALTQAIAARLSRLYRWQVDPDAILVLPGVEPGFNMALRALVRPGGTVAVHVPAYRPILAAPGHWGLARADIPVDADAAAIRAALAPGDALLLCNPHNPTGRVFTRAELEGFAQAALSAGALIVSDEIHADLVFDGRAHLPIATLAPEVAARTVTLMSAGKAFNIAGLKTAFAVIPDAGLRARFAGARLGMVDSVNAMGLEATLAAFTACEGWLADLIAYLQGNRDMLLARPLPGIRMAPPQGTFLAWLDCRDAGLGADPAAALLDRARVALSPGSDFAAPGFARLNFGCSRAVLAQALDRIAAALPNPGTST